jgi:hypothetical protein
VALFAALAPFAALALPAVRAVAQIGQPRVNLLLERNTLLDNLGPQLGNCRPRLRLDQLPFAGPRLLMFRADLGEDDVGRFAPGINENCGRLERWRREFGGLPV